MVGMITEKDWDAINQTFPGMQSFYEGLNEKPRTFLELEWLFIGLEGATNNTEKSIRRVQ